MRRNSSKAVLFVPAIAGMFASCTLTSLNAGYDVGGAGGVGGGSGGQGAGAHCSPGETRSCYSGPSGTESKGICKAGVETCAPDGMSWGACAGEVLPQSENCATPEDEDCDGQAPACQGDVGWMKGLGDGDNQQGLSVAVDASGNVLVTGVFSGTLDFGLGPLVSAGGGDLFVAKLDPNGVPIWSVSFGDGLYQAGSSIAADTADNVLVTGVLEGTMSLGFGQTLTSGGARDLFVLKLDPNGAPIWGKSFGDIDDQSGTAVAADRSGNVLVTGYIRGSMDLGIGPPLMSAGDSDSDMVVLKLSPSGVPIWGRRFGEPSDLQEGYGIATDTKDDVIVTGRAGAGMDLGLGPLSGAFVAKLDAAGALLWNQSFGDYVVSYDVKVDALDNIFVGGAFEGSITVGADQLAANGTGDLFVAKLSPTGAPLWGRGYGDSNFQMILSIAPDAWGNLLVTGVFDGSIDLGLGQPLVSDGADDIFVVKLASNGTPLWGKKFGGMGVQRVGGVAVDIPGNAYVTGYYWGEIDAGSDTLTNPGAYDLFLAKLRP